MMWHWPQKGSQQGSVSRQQCCRCLHLCAVALSLAYHICMRQPVANSHYMHLCAAALLLAYHIYMRQPVANRHYMHLCAVAPRVARAHRLSHYRSPTTSQLVLHPYGLVSAVVCTLRHVMQRPRGFLVRHRKECLAPSHGCEEPTRGTCRCLVPVWSRARLRTGPMMRCFGGATPTGRFRLGGRLALLSGDHLAGGDTERVTWTGGVSPVSEKTRTRGWIAEREHLVTIRANRAAASGMPPTNAALHLPVPFPVEKVCKPTQIVRAARLVSKLES